MLAQIIDTLAAANYMTAGGKGEKPKPVPRPADLKEVRERRERTLERAAKFQARHRANQ